jgi:hypothetical protein
MRQLAILILLACTACATRADGPAVQQPASSVAAGGAQAPRAEPAATPAPGGTLAQIHSLVGKAECTSDSQCQVLPIGAKACGGPASFLAFSTAKTDPREVQVLAERHHAEQQANNQRSGMISNCRVEPTPAAACRANTCQLTNSLPAR